MVATVTVTTQHDNCSSGNKSAMVTWSTLKVFPPTFMHTRICTYTLTLFHSLQQMSWSDHWKVALAMVAHQPMPSQQIAKPLLARQDLLSNYAAHIVPTNICLCPDLLSASDAAICHVTAVVVWLRHMAGDFVVLRFPHAVMIPILPSSFPNPLLPDLKTLSYSAIGDASGAFAAFIDSHQNAGGSVTLLNQITYSPV